MTQIPVLVTRTYVNKTSYITHATVAHECYNSIEIVEIVCLPDYYILRILFAHEQYIW